MVALAALWATGLAHRLNWADVAQSQEQLVGWIQHHPLSAPMVNAVLYVLTTALSLPEGAVLTVAGGLLFGAVLGGALAVIGASVGAVLLFLATRSAFAQWREERASPGLARSREELHHNGFLYLLAIRLVPIFPFWLVNLAATLAGVRLASFATATYLGIIPATFVYAWIGADVGGVIAAERRLDLSLVFSPSILIPLLALAGLALLPVL